MLREYRARTCRQTRTHGAQCFRCRTQLRICDNLSLVSFPSKLPRLAASSPTRDYILLRRFAILLLVSLDRKRLSSFFPPCLFYWFVILVLVFLNESDECIAVSFPDCWDMITSPSASALKNSEICVVWESSSSSRGGGSSSRNSSINKPFLHSAPPSDPLRQANRLPIKVLKMLTARSGHILHPEYLQPLPSTPVSPIEVRRAFKKKCF